MVANGVVLPDLTPKPCAWEIKQAQAPVIIKREEPFAGMITAPNKTDATVVNFIIKNRYNSLCTDAIACEAVVIANGAERLRFPVALPAVKPNGDGAFSLDFAEALALEGEVYVNFLITASRELPLLPKGHAVAQYQFKIKNSAVLPVRVGNNDMHEMAVSHDGALLTLSSGAFNVKFDMEACLLRSYEKNGVCFLSGGTENIARARSGVLLEGGKWWGAAYHVWKHILPGGFTREALGASYAKSEPRGGAHPVPGYVSVRLVSKLTGPKGEIHTEQTYTVYASGEIKLDVIMDIAQDYVHVPRAGLSFVVPGGFEKLRWYGRGPGESYCDRTLSSPVGIYESTVEGTHFPFVPPSHNGSHADTRWLEMTGPHGNTLKITGASFSFNAHHNTAEDYWNASHEHKLIRREEIFLDLDGFQAGIGGDMAWSSEINAKHLIPAGLHRFGFTLTAV
jgi:beta-galactosidase